MARTPGKVVFREYQTHDPVGARRFYGGLFGWTFEQAADYTAILRGETQVGGLFDLARLPSGGQGQPAQWYGYVSVPDVDAAAARASATGGQIRFGPEDLPGIGRVAFVGDPQGGGLYLFDRAGGDPPAAPPVTGDFAFELLNAPDPATLAPFYAGVVGWTQAAMGPMPMFQDAAGQFVSVVAPAPPGVPAHWITHVVVDDLAAANDRAMALGGEVLEPRIDVPGYGAFALIKDPAGAVIMTFLPVVE